MTKNEQGIRRVGALALAIVGVIHLVLAPEYLDEQPYIGVLFIAGGATAILLAIRLWLVHDRVAWSIGAAIAAGMFAAFVLSRTTGLPGFKEEEWELSGIVSLVLEAGFIGAFAASLRAKPAGARARRSSPARARPRTAAGSPATHRP